MSATRSPMMTQGAMVFPVVARGGVADLAAQFDGGYRGLQIVGVRQHIWLDLHRVARVWAGQTDMAAALWPDHAREQCPASIRQSESAYVLRTGLGKFSLAGLQIR